MCYIKNMKKIVPLFVCCLFVFSGCGKIKDQVQDNKEKKMRRNSVEIYNALNSEQKKKKSAFEKYVSSVSLHDKVYQLFIENLEGDTIFVPVEKDFVPGGYLFFGYNLADSPAGIIKFTDSIKKYCAKNGIIPPFLAIDQEGGLVNRLKIVNGPLPSAEKIASRADIDSAYKIYSAQAEQMRNLGFDMNIAPVVEVKTAENEHFLNGRSFGDFQKVKEFGTACVNAYENHGIGTVVKHFPGNTNTDPHSGLPEILLSGTELEESLKPFFEINRCAPAGALMSHARVKSVDGEIPACFSRRWVSEILRGEIGFEGIVFSDDIFMGALALNGFPPEEAAVRALEAGVNVIMVSEKRISGPAKVLISKAEKDSDFEKLIDNSFRKVMEYKIRQNLVSFEKDENGNYSVVPVLKKESVAARVEKFNKARKENIDIYIEKIDYGEKN